MELNNYRLLKIPFASKKKIDELFGNKIKNKYSFSGVAYYLVDTEKYCIVWERAILNEFEYRPTDGAMETTSYYESILKKEIDRTDWLGYSETNFKVEVANQEQINWANKISLKKIKTVLNIEGLLSGSNPTGSDAEFKKSPILIDPRYETEYIYFVNAIKRIRCHDKVLNNVLVNLLNEVKDIEEHFNDEITINELAEKNSMFRKWIKIVNSDLNDNNIDDEDIKAYVENVSNNEIKDSVYHIIAMSKLKYIEEAKAIEKLRREFRLSLLKEATENNYSEYSGKRDLAIKDTEAAHILGVSEIKKYNLDLEWIANPNNGLLLSPELHTILDKNKIFLNENGEFLPNSDEYSDFQAKLLKEILNGERIEFIKRRNEYLN